MAYPDYADFFSTTREFDSKTQVLAKINADGKDTFYILPNDVNKSDFCLWAQSLFCGGAEFLFDSGAEESILGESKVEILKAKNAERRLKEINQNAKSLINELYPNYFELSKSRRYAARNNIKKRLGENEIGVISR